MPVVTVTSIGCLSSSWPASLRIVSIFNPSSIKVEIYVFLILCGLLYKIPKCLQYFFNLHDTAVSLIDSPSLLKRYPSLVWLRRFISSSFPSHILWVCCFHISAISIFSYTYDKSIILLSNTYRKISGLNFSFSSFSSMVASTPISIIIGSPNKTFSKPLIY